jgi:hypothetical protein
MSPTAAMVTGPAPAAAPVLPGEAADGLAGAGCAVAELATAGRPGVVDWAAGLSVLATLGEDVSEQAVRLIAPTVPATAPHPRRLTRTWCRLPGLIASIYAVRIYAAPGKREARP